MPLPTGVALALLAVALAAYGLRRWRRRTVRRLRTRKAVQGELDAEQLLEQLGYQIIARQPRHHWCVWVGDEPRDIELRADYLVRSGGCDYIAEVKTGGQAPSIDTAATRRQLLEYAVAYDVAGVLLVDMEANELHTIDFGTTPAPAQGGFVAGLIVGALTATAVFLLRG